MLKNIKNNALKFLDKRRYSENIFYRLLVSLRDEFSLCKIRAGKNLAKKTILPKYKSIYIHIPKVAQSSISEYLIGLGDPRIFLTRRWSSRIQTKYEDYFKFSFVRNPYDRIVSLYHNKISNNKAKDFEYGVFRGFLKYGKFYPSMPFKEFVKSISSIPDHESDPHFVSQSYLLKNNKRELIPDFVGKFENLKEDFSYVCSKMNLENPLPLPHKKESKKKRDYRKYYDEETKKILEKRYSEDLKKFGYSF